MFGSTVCVAKGLARLQRLHRQTADCCVTVNENKAFSGIGRGRMNVRVLLGNAKCSLQLRTSRDGRLT
jgi:hypothetical protein